METVARAFFGRTIYFKRIRLLLIAYRQFVMWTLANERFSELCGENEKERKNPYCLHTVWKSLPKYWINKSIQICATLFDVCNRVRRLEHVMHGCKFWEWDYASSLPFESIRGGWNQRIANTRRFKTISKHFVIQRCHLEAPLVFRTSHFV